jgi:hypothetical protein
MYGKTGSQASEEKNVVPVEGDRVASLKRGSFMNRPMTKQMGHC